MLSSHSLYQISALGSGKKNCSQVWCMKDTVDTGGKQRFDFDYSSLKERVSQAGQSLKSTYLPFMYILRTAVYTLRWAFFH